MRDFLSSSVFFGVILSFLGYYTGLLLKKRFRLAIFNPLFIAIVFVIGFLLLFDLDYERYHDSASYLSYLMTPATVCLAVPLYRQLRVLKKNYKAIFAGIVAGVLASMASVFLLCLAFGLTHEQYVTLLPKSVTSAIGMSISEELGGIPALTVAVIILTGVLGNLSAPMVLKLLRIKEPVAKGVAIGTSSHAIGTAKALEMGETEAAMSSLSIVIAGLLTVLCASLFGSLI